VDRLIAEAGEIDVLIANAALPASGRLEYTPAPAHGEPARADHPRQGLRPTVGRAGRRAYRADRLAGRQVVLGGIVAVQRHQVRAARFRWRVRQDLHGSGVGVSVVQPGFVSDDGMFADSGAQLPRGIRTVSPDAVAEAVARAIEHDRGEVDVAPIEMKVAALLGGVFPELAARVQRRTAGETSAALVESQRHKRFTSDGRAARSAGRRRRSTKFRR
jgi:hypothetical protein